MNKPPTISSSLLMSITFEHPLSAKLLALREAKLFTDLVFTSSHGDLKCHSHLLIPYCSRLTSGVTSLDVSMLSEPAFKVLELVIPYFYGGVVYFDEETRSQLAEVSRVLECPLLFDLCGRSKRDDVSKLFTIEPEKLVKELVQHNEPDFSFNYNGQEFKTFRFLLAAYFPYFREKWTLNCPDSQDSSTDFTDKFSLSNDEVFHFISSLNASQCQIFPSQMYACHHLSQYFGYEDMTEAIMEAVFGLTPESHWVERFMVQANDHEDLVFLKKLSMILNKYPNFILERLILFRGNSFKCLAENLINGPMINWLLGCMVQSYSNVCLAASEFIVCLHAIRVENVDVQNAHALLGKLEQSHMCDAILRFYGRFVPKLMVETRQKEEIETKKQQKRNQTLVNLHRRVISSIWDENGEEVGFHSLSDGLRMLKKPPNTLFCDHSYSTFTQSCFAVHPMNGSVKFSFQNVRTGCSVGFFDEENDKLYGLWFSDGSTCKLLDGQEMLSWQRNDAVVFAFNFETSQNICVSVPSRGIYVPTEIPAGSLLKVTLVPNTHCRIE
ncbi:hypothetical protein RCL1_003427 [Eukaryota sp. TZLM3-RCL]